MGLLADRVVIVTGAGRGIGRGEAIECARQGAAVVVNELDADAGAAVVAEIVAAGGSAVPDSGDVADTAAADKIVATALAEFGRLDALVNNAGIASPANGPVEKLRLTEWNRRIGVNLTGASLMAKHAAPHLRRVRGAIVNIASTRALQSEPDTEAYAASKGGLVALTHALALSLGPQVRVNCISPGWIADEPVKKRDHEQHPVGRVGRVEDVAELVAYLLSEGAGFVTGQNFVIDGGMTKKLIYV
jgi:NAD(P)-dependent dehydrogenase (short-subunit alcohol dehydrogenase family)